MHKIYAEKVHGDPDATAPTICEVFRRIYRMAEHIEADDPVSAGRIKREAEVGHDMAKRMYKALVAYKTGKTPDEDVDCE